jgi:hypothetical protein
VLCFGHLGDHDEGTGTCSVTATKAADANYSIATAVATVGATPALATVTLTPTSLSQTYSGSPEPALFTVLPTNVAVTASYTGIAPTVYGPTSDAPTNPGTYSATATVADPNYTGMATGTLTVNLLDPKLQFALLTGMPDQTP